MPISTNTDPVTRIIESGREYAIQATGGSLTVQVERNGALHTEGTVADGERLRLNIAHDLKKAEVTFTPSAAGVDWSLSPVKVEDN